MKAIQITNEILNKNVENKPSRFDMAVNFYCCIRQNGKYYLVTYYYNPAWDLWYPFYDDVNKAPIVKTSNSKTYRELIEETNQVLNVDIENKLKLAYKRFEELIGCKCKVKQSKLGEMFELKYSKTANQFSIYKLYNFIITDVENLEQILNPKKLKCKLFELNKLDNSKIVGNAISFCKKAQNELKENAIEC